MTWIFNLFQVSRVMAGTVQISMSVLKEQMIAILMQSVKTLMEGGFANATMDFSVTDKSVWTLMNAAMVIFQQFS